MTSTDPQFIYMVLILPGLFSITLMGEGIVKIIQSHVSGWFNLVTGIIFLTVVVGGYLILKSNW